VVVGAEAATTLKTEHLEAVEVAQYLSAILLLLLVKHTQLQLVLVVLVALQTTMAIMVETHLLAH
jgi:hypothetical protein